VAGGDQDAQWTAVWILGHRNKVCECVLYLNTNLPNQVLIVIPPWRGKGSILNAQKGDLNNHPLIID
jgi:hypothetical protein